MAEYKNKELTYKVFSPNLKNFRKNHVELKILIISKILSTQIKIYIQYPVHINYSIWYYVLNVLWWHEVGKLQNYVRDVQRQIDEQRTPEKEKELSKGRSVGWWRVSLMSTRMMIW